MSRINEFSPGAERRFADRVSLMQRDLKYLGQDVVSGVNSFAAVGSSEALILGMSAVAAGTAVRLHWDPVLARNLRHYEVLIGSTSTLVDGVSRLTTQPEYIDTEGGPNVTRYAKVRAVLADGSPTAWSPIINLNSGLLLTDSLEFAAALNHVIGAFGTGVDIYQTQAILDGTPATYRVLAHSLMDISGSQDGSPPNPFYSYQGFDIGTIIAGGVEIFTIGGPVGFRVTMTILFFFTANIGLKLSIIRDGEFVTELGSIGYSVSNIMARGAITVFAPGMSVLDLPPPGLHSYELGVAVTVDPGFTGGGYFEIYSTRMSALEYRR